MWKIAQSPQFELRAERIARRSPRSDALALEISDALVHAGLHRSVPVPDVLIASVALAEGLTVLHDDRDFQRIAEVMPRLAHERLQL